MAPFVAFGKAFGAALLPLLQRLGPAKVCWLCITGTCAIGWFASTHFAPAAELQSVATSIAELKQSAASKADLGLVASSLRSIRADSVAQRAYDAKVRWCAAGTDRRWLNDQLETLQSEYEELTGKRRDFPPCDQL